KAGPLPGKPNQPVPELLIERIHLFFAVRGGGESNAPVGMKMIYVREGKKCMQRCIDRGSYRIVAERTERIQAHHLVFQFDATVDLRQGEHLVEVQRGKTLDLDA